MKEKVNMIKNSLITSVVVDQLVKSIVPSIGLDLNTGQYPFSFNSERDSGIALSTVRFGKKRFNCLIKDCHNQLDLDKLYHTF